MHDFVGAWFCQLNLNFIHWHTAITVSQVCVQAPDKNGFDDNFAVLSVLSF